MKKYLWGAVFAVLISTAGYKLWCASTDIWAESGQGALNNLDVVRVDGASTPNLKLGYGDLVLGDGGYAPSSTYSYALQMPYTNQAGASIAAGSVLISSQGATGCTTTTALATTTVLGVADATVAYGSVGYAVSYGYALVLTTGSVAIGDLLVATNTAAGYAGRATGTVAVGSVVGKAMAIGTPSGGLTLTFVNLQ